MAQRTYRAAHEALDIHPYRNDQERREFHQYWQAAEAEAIADVQKAAAETIIELRDRVEGVEDQYAARDREAEQLRADIASGRITAKDAGKRVDKLRRELEQLDPLGDSLRAAHDEAQRRFEDPLAFRDAMYERFPALAKPDWPW